MEAILGIVAMTLWVACGDIRNHRQLEQPVNATLTTGIGGTLFRLNKVGDLPNAFGGRDIWGGKVDKGFAEMKLAAIEGSTLLLDVIDVNRQSTETVMDRYKPFQRNAVVNVEVNNKIVIDGEHPHQPYRINLDTHKQSEIVISGMRVTFVEVLPYSVRYTVEDLQR
jgi:hypothetical protein